jgi:hypothetical protein
MFKNSRLTGRSKMVRCKEAKNPGRAVYLTYISGLDLFADEADYHFGAACYRQEMAESICKRLPEYKNLAKDFASIMREKWLGKE